MTLSNPTSGHAPGLPAVTRRALILSAPALAAAPLALEAATPPADPLLGLLALREQQRLDWLAMGQLHGGDSPEDKAAWDAFAATETTMATSPEGVAGQIRYLLGSYGPGLIELPERPAINDVPFAILDVILEGLGRIGQ